MAEETVEPDTTIETAFVVYLNTDGTATATAEFPTEQLVINRVATITDIERVSEIVLKEIRDTNLAARVAANVAMMFMPPPEETPADQVSAALADRGIHPESQSDTP